MTITEKALIYFALKRSSLLSFVLKRPSLLPLHHPSHHASFPLGWILLHNFRYAPGPICTSYIPNLRVQICKHILCLVNATKSSWYFTAFVTSFIVMVKLTIQAEKVLVIAIGISGANMSMCKLTESASNQASKSFLNFTAFVPQLLWLTRPKTNQPSRYTLQAS